MRGVVDDAEKTILCVCIIAAVASLPEAVLQQEVNPYWELLYADSVKLCLGGTNEAVRNRRT